MVGEPAQRHARNVRQARSQLEQPARRLGCDDEGRPRDRSAAGRAEYRRVSDVTPRDEPPEETTQDAEEVIVTARPRPRSSHEKGLDHHGRDGVERGDALRLEMPIEQPERVGLGLVAAPEHPLVRDELRDLLRQWTGESLSEPGHRIASPSPSATSRSASIATLL